MPQVSFIFGKGRSGSTIIGDILGSVQDVVHAGEVWRLWASAVDGPHTCSCGSPVRRCPVWGEVISRMSKNVDAAWTLDDIDEFVGLQRRLYTFGGLLSLPVSRARYRSDSDRYRDAMRVVYTALAETTKASLIVDSSKWPLDPSLVDPPEGIESSGVLLVRDPSGVASSWQSVKTFPDTGEPMPIFSPAHTALSWTSRQLLGEFVLKKAQGRAELLRYEDFVSRPRDAVQRILDLSGGQYDANQVFEGDRSVRIAPGHTVMGNPSRFAAGTIEVKQSTHEISKSLALNAVTWLLRRRYGYA